MRKTPQTGPTRASAKAVSSLGLRCVGALATQHACSRLHYRPAPESDVLNGRQPRRGHEPASASARACVATSAARVPPPTPARTDLRVAGEPSCLSSRRVRSPDGASGRRRSFCRTALLLPSEGLAEHLTDSHSHREQSVIRSFMAVVRQYDKVACRHPRAPGAVSLVWPWGCA